MSRTRHGVLSWLICGLGCMVTTPHLAEISATEPQVSPAALAPEPLSESDRDHWSFQPIQRPPLPRMPQMEQLVNPIDSFIASELETVGLQLAPAAEPATLLRRLKFDLLGLPPTPAELAEFERDMARDPSRYAHWVDRWLSSPAFGEHLAQPWLDLARFAETDGFEHDKVRPAAWEYRDWVIQALNADMPYSQFIALQLHADLTGSPADRVATMFCLAGADMPDLNEQDLRRHDRLNELTSTVGSALLGLQMQCAQCHDHKYDPISQVDFYRLRAVFESAVPPLERDKPFNIFAGQVEQSPGRLYYRGDVRVPGPELKPGFPRVATPAHCSTDCESDQPRQALVAWLFSPENPLTARIIVNRVWQHHFGAGLFENPSDVGLVAGGPSHPALLDWLAGSLRDRDWSLKWLHREIVLSHTYRQTSQRLESDPQWDRRLEIDADQRLLSRFPRQRLTGESLRDALLSVAGLLDFQAAGPSVMPPLPQELLGTLRKGQWAASPTLAEHHRRSIYVFARRNLRYPLFDVFDRPDAGASCPERNQSTTALQSLQLLNSEFASRCAAALAERVTRQVGSEATPQAWLEQLFWLTLSRGPSAHEADLFAPWIADATHRPTACLALLNTSEFLFVD